MSEKHYALFMSSLSARSRELFFCGSIHFEERNDVNVCVYCIILYGNVEIFKRLIRRREAWYCEIVTRAPSLPFQ